MRRVILFFMFSPNEQCGGWGEGMLPDFFILFFFPCSAYHERDWPPCQVVFFGLATNALNVRNNNDWGMLRRSRCVQIIIDLGRTLAPACRKRDIPY